MSYGSPSTPDVGCREAGGRDQGTEERGWSGLAEQDCDLKQTFRASQRLTEGPVHRGSLCTHKIISRHFMESSDLDDSTLYEERTVERVMVFSRKAFIEGEGTLSWSQGAVCLLYSTLGTQYSTP